MKTTIAITTHGYGAAFFLQYGLPSLLASRERHTLNYNGDASFAITAHNYSLADQGILGDLLEQARCQFKIGSVRTDGGPDEYARTVTGAERRRWPCSLMPDSDVFIYLEDDMLFGENTFTNYLDAAEYLQRNPHIGVVYHTGTMGAKPHQYGRAEPYTGSLAWSGRGLTFRNIQKDGKDADFYVSRSIPEQMCFEDKAVIYTLPYLGYGVARMFGTNTRHFTADSALPPRYAPMFKHKIGNNYRTMTHEQYSAMPDHKFFSNIFNLSRFGDKMPRLASDVKRLGFTRIYQALIEAQSLK